MIWSVVCKILIYYIILTTATNHLDKTNKIGKNYQYFKISMKILII